MIVKVDLLDQWLERLGGHDNIAGAYEQGSGVWGFADENSDRDFIVVWRNDYPDKDKRQKVLENLGGVVHEFQDIPAVKKGVDLFESEMERLNVAHIRADDFFSFYEGLNNLGKYYDEQLLRIGGFVNGKIHYDPEGKLEKHRQDMKLTDAIVGSVEVKLRNELGYDLKILEIAAKRGGVIQFVQQMSEVLYQMHIWYYMRKKMWLMSDKWFEAFARKFVWEDDFVSLLREIREGLEMKKIAMRLLAIAKEWGFEPGKKFKS